MIVERMTDLIGNTPMLKIPAEIHGLKNIDLYAKLEMMNPFGSVKDRIGWGMIKDDIDSIRKDGQVIFENSSGNTAKALCAIAATYGVKFKLVSAIAKVKETKDLLRLLGAEIEEFAAASDCFDPNDPNDPQFLIEKAVREQAGAIHFPSQFTNPKNPQAHYDSTGQEIINDLGRVDYFIAGLGTTGSTLGISRRLRDANPDCVCVGLTSAKGDFVPGIRSMDQMWESGLFQKDNYNDLRDVREAAAIDAMLTLNRDLGVLCGPSSGANLAGSLDYLREVDANLIERKTAVFIVCDRVEWYMSYIRERRPELFGEAAKPQSLKSFVYNDSMAANDRYAVPVQGAAQWMAEQNPMIIDVRGNLAYRMQSIPGSVNIPGDLFEAMIDSSDPFPKDRSILLVCPVGEKTARYAAYLQGRGYKAFSLGGGILGWRDLGAEMVRVA